MKKIWLDHYPKDVPTVIDEKQYQSVIQLFEESCHKFADLTAYESFGTRMSYAELDRQSRNFASWLHHNGLRKGDAVVLMLPNLLQYPVCLFGILRAGCVMVNSNPLYKPRELAHQLNDSKAKAIVIAENFAHVLEGISDRKHLQQILVTCVGDMLGGIKGIAVNLIVRYIKRAIPSWSLPGHIKLKDAMDLGSKQKFNAPELIQTDLAFLQYTGGTTGVPKSAMLSHGNLVANLCQIYAWTKPIFRIGKECIVTALPLYHIFALTANCLMCIKLGARNVLVVDARNINGLIKQMRKSGMTGFTGVNTLFNALLNHPKFSQLDFSKLRLTLGGGMAVQRSVAERWKKVTGTSLTQAYGLTESSPAVTINPIDDTQIDNSIGLPLPSTDVEVRNDKGVEVAIGEIGEICVRGPQVMTGYWQQPEETALVFHPDGFLRTGDVGYMNDAGFVFLVDRKKDIILVSGFNVYPNEIEDVVSAHPSVVEAAVIGVPDTKSGEVVKLFVVRKNKSLTKKALIAYCRQQLTGYKIPRHIEFRDELPHSNVGKIMRRELR